MDGVHHSKASARTMQAMQL